MKLEDFCKETTTLIEKTESPVYLKLLKQILKDQQELEPQLAEIQTLFSSLTKNLETRYQIQKNFFQQVKRNVDESKLLQIENNIQVEDHKHFYLASTWMTTLVKGQKKRRNFYSAYTKSGDTLNKTAKGKDNYPVLGDQFYETTKNLDFFLGTTAELHHFRYNGKQFDLKNTFRNCKAIVPLELGMAIIQTDIGSFLYSTMTGKRTTPYLSYLGRAPEEDNDGLLIGRIDFSSSPNGTTVEREAFTFYLTPVGRISPFCNLETGETIQPDEVDFDNDFRSFKQLRCEMLEEKAMQKGKEQQRQRIFRKQNQQNLLDAIHQQSTTN